MGIKVSIIMSVFAEIDYVEQSIESILNQSFKEFEFIIVVDTLNEKILAKVESFDDSRIIVIKNEYNKGLTKSLNIAIKESNGKYIARIDADDIAAPERIKKQYEFLEQNPDIAILGTNAYVINDVGGKIGEIKLNTSNKKINSGLLFKNQLIHPAVMIRRTVFEKHGFYNEHMVRSQDYELWLRVRKHEKFYNLNERLLNYRKHKSSITQANNIQQRLAGIDMMFNYLKLNKSCLSLKEKLLILLFFIKQFFKIVKLAFK